MLPKPFGNMHYTQHVYKCYLCKWQHFLRL